jgi:hypothetical protein
LRRAEDSAPYRRTSVHGCGSSTEQISLDPLSAGQDDFSFYAIRLAHYVSPMTIGVPREVEDRECRTVVKRGARAGSLGGETGEGLVGLLDE